MLFLILGLVVTAALGLFTDSITAMLHAPEAAFAETSIYIRICGIGDSKTPLVTVCIACVMNIVGDLFFVAVLGMGAAGAALATVISQASSVIILHRWRR